MKKKIASNVTSHFDIKKIIKTVSFKEIKDTQKMVKRHFEGGVVSAQMNMIAFD